MSKIIRVDKTNKVIRTNSSVVTTSNINDAVVSTSTTWSSDKINTAKQNTLVSGTNIKTINNESLLGSGNIEIQGISVDSVNGQTGVVVLDADDISDAATVNKFATAGELADIALNTAKRHDPVTVIDSSEIDFTLTGQQITASIIAGSIDETKLDTSVNASLDLADSSLQSSDIGVTVQAHSTVLDNTTASFTTTDETKLDGIEAGAEVNNISDINATDLTDGGDTTLHIHDSRYYTEGEVDTLLNGKLDTNNYTINSISNGVITGGQLSINVDPTKFDITNGSGVIVDSYTNPLNPVVYPVSWSGLTAQTVTNIGTQTITHVFIDRLGAVYQSGVVNADLRRDYIYLGALGHTNLTTIGSAVPLPDVQTGAISKLRDFITAVGVINYGNVISANGANLSINKSAGTLTKNGANFYNDNKNPNEIVIASATAPTFRYRTQTGAGTTTNLIDPTKYDVGGVITTIGSTKATNQRVYLNTVGNIVIQYGQILYNSLSSAVAGIQNANFIIYPNLEEAGFILIGVISVMSNATILNDTNSAIFTRVSKFGESTGATAGLSTTTLQQAYDNSVSPEILSDTTRGAFTVKRGTASDTDTVFEAQNGAGSVTASITGAGVITGSNLSGTNTGDQTSIVGITGTKSQFDTAVTDGNFLYVGDITQYTDEQAQDAVGAMVDTTLTYVDGTPLLQRSALTGAITASAGSNTTALGSFTTVQLNTALSDNNVATLAGNESLTNKTLTGSTNTVTLYDTNFTLQDDADPTRQAKFNASSISASTTRTLSLPNVSDTLVARSSTDTLTNKTIDLTSNTLSGTTLQFNAALTGDDFVFATRAVNTSTGLTGGGALSADRTIALDINALTTDTAPDLVNDFLLEYDTSATGHKKVTPKSLLTFPKARASLSANQNVTGSTKVQFNTEAYDTNGWYDPTTNFRFTPLISGYYAVTAVLYYGSGTSTECQVRITKNGATISGLDVVTTANTGMPQTQTLVEMNGTTDYIEIFGFTTGAITRTLDSNWCYVIYTLATF